MKNQNIPHYQPIFRGTIARLAIQCPCPDTGITGDFLFTGESVRNKGSRVTPIYEDLYECFPALRTDWEQVAGDAGTYTKR